MSEPLTNESHDVSGLDGFMLNTDLLMASELWALATGDEFKAAVGLWCRAWKQTPPGSLPDDDRVLAAFSGAGKAWPKVKDMALRGFVKCSDGRLYHTTLCADVIRASAAKAARQARTKAATEARQKERNVERNVDRYVGAEPNVTKSHRRDGTGREDKTSSTANTRPPAQEFKPPEPVASSPAALRSQELETKLRKAAGWESHPSPKLFITGPIEQLIETGASLERDVLPVISAIAPKVSKPNWNFFIDPIREAMAKRVSAGRPLDDKTEADRAAKKAAAAKYLEELSAGGPHGNG